MKMCNISENVISFLLLVSKIIAFISNYMLLIRLNVIWYKNSAGDIAEKIASIFSLISCCITEQ